MLKWQSQLIPRSLTEVDTELNKLALGIHKSLLGYMGGDPRARDAAAWAWACVRPSEPRPSCRARGGVTWLMTLSTSDGASSDALMLGARNGLAGDDAMPFITGLRQEGVSLGQFYTPKV